jgi:DNA (cytosine-5)-methyltransferase 1
MLTYATVCSGIECMSVACRGLPLKPVFFSEIEPFPCAVLKAHYPDVPNLGDITQVDWSKYHGLVDLIVGGSPCQGFSQAGYRRGLRDSRSSLALAYVQAVERVQPRWLLWENVPGVLSTNDGEDFRAFLAALDDLGFGLAWAVLDSQWVGVAQRRRRVFVVGHLGR